MFLAATGWLLAFERVEGGGSQKALMKQRVKKH